MSSEERDAVLREQLHGQLVREEETKHAHKGATITPVVLLRNLRTHQTPKVTTTAPGTDQHNPNQYHPHAADVESPDGDTGSSSNCCPLPASCPSASYLSSRPSGIASCAART